MSKLHIFLEFLFLSLALGFQQKAFEGSRSVTSAKNGITRNKSSSSPIVMKNGEGDRRFKKSMARRANVNSRLHITTETAPVGIGKSISSLPNRVLAQGKRQIWSNFQLNLSDSIATPALLKARNASLVAAALNYGSAEIELERYHLYCKLRQELGNLVKSRGVKCAPPLLSFERWQFECMCAQEEQGANGAAKDPLFPHVPDYLEPQLIDDLSRIGLSRRDAADVSREMMRQSCASAARLAARHEEAHGLVDTVDVTPVTNRHNVDLKLGPAARDRFKVNHEHVAKLRTLWARSRAESLSCTHPPGAAAEPTLDGCDAESRRFRRDLFRLLVRYQARRGVPFCHTSAEQKWPQGTRAF